MIPRYKISVHIQKRITIAANDLRKIMPMREIVAGDAQLKSCVSNRKLTFGPNWILSPEGMVSSLLSSSTELSDSIHSGSMSPSHTIHDCTSVRRYG